MSIHLDRFLPPAYWIMLAAIVALLVITLSGAPVKPDHDTCTPPTTIGQVNHA